MARTERTIGVQENSEVFENDASLKAARGEFMMELCPVLASWKVINNNKTQTKPGNKIAIKSKIVIWIGLDFTSITFQRRRITSELTRAETDYTQAESKKTTR